VGVLIISQRQSECGEQGAPSGYQRGGQEKDETESVRLQTGLFILLVDSALLENTALIAV
jgi:hypothetical protein